MMSSYTVLLLVDIAAIVIMLFIYWQWIIERRDRIAAEESAKLTGQKLKLAYGRIESLNATLAAYKMEQADMGVEQK